jgi:hypothetical protein
MAESEFPIEIHDPKLDAAALARRVTEGVAQRRAEGAYSPDVATIGPESLRPGWHTLSDESASAEFPGLAESLAELIARGPLHEPDFASQAPVVGPLIVAVRRLWNWMSTKWYVRPILGQQSDVNVRTARLLSDLAQWQAMEGQRLRELEARLAELEARLEAGSKR